MSTITYKCNVCQRQIEKRENKSGLTVFGKCIITQNCHGQMYTLNRNLDNVREIFPFSVGGLIDYTPRKAFYEHTQTLLSTTWLVTHDLSTSPAVSAYVSIDDGPSVQLNQDDFTVTVVTKNSVNLTFKQAYRGVAQCVARSTTVTESPAVTTSTEIKITNGGIITMAIPEVVVNPPPIPNINMNSLPFNLELNIQRPNESILSSLETIGSELNTLSAWHDWPRILVRKRKNYVIRTKNIFELLIFGTNASPTDIANGTKFRFSAIAFPSAPLRTLESRELFFLLSSSPYASIDKVKDKLIDVGEMIDTPIDYFTYRNGELYVNSTVVEKTFPSINKVIN